MNAQDFIITISEAKKMFESVQLAGKEYDIKHESLSQKQLEQVTSIPVDRYQTVDDFIDAFMIKLSKASHGDIVLTQDDRITEIRREKGTYEKQEAYIKNIDAKKK